MSRRGGVEADLSLSDGTKDRRPFVVWESQHEALHRLSAAWLVGGSLYRRRSPSGVIAVYGTSTAGARSLYVGSTAGS